MHWPAVRGWWLWGEEFTQTLVLLTRTMLKKLAEERKQAEAD